MLINNATHHALFSLPPIQLSEQRDVAVPELPAQVVVTGDKEVDAVLWLHSVIETGQAALIEKAMEAAKRIKTPLKDLEERYSAHLIKAHPGNFMAALSSFGFADLEDMARRSAKKLALIRPRTTVEAVAVFRFLVDNEYMDRAETNDILLNLIGGDPKEVAP